MPTDPGDGNGRISLSQAQLRAELLALELRLTEKLQVKADATTVHELNGRVQAAEGRLADLDAHVLRREGPIAQKIDSINDRMSRWEALDPATAMARLTNRVDAVEDATLNPDKVAQMIGEALRQNQARGWTTRERVLQALVALSGLATFAMLASTRIG